MSVPNQRVSHAMQYKGRARDLSHSLHISKSFSYHVLRYTAHKLIFDHTSNGGVWTHQNQRSRFISTCQVASWPTAYRASTDHDVALLPVKGFFHKSVDVLSITHNLVGTGTFIL